MSTDPAGMTKTAADTADEYIEACAQIYDTCLFPGLGDVLRDAWREIRALVVPPHCDCPLDPHHRWNCALTPVWAQTIRELDTNPWTAVRSATWAFEDIRAEIRVVNRFSWDGSPGTYCGRGPCCLGDNHDGRCRM